MGKSDPHIFRFYSQQLESQEFKSSGFFGQPGENNFSRWIVSQDKNFYDLSLSNWKINSFPYQVNKKFDLIVCTRCAYFSKYPQKLIKEFSNMLTPNGKILIDWGIGDHWRFKNYKIGWVKEGEHEWCYHEDNFLWSGYMSKKMTNCDDYKKFEKACQKFGYENVEKAFQHEIPCKIDENTIKKQGLKIIKESSLFLWPESPQLYTALVLENE